jgi:hypothetical protein
VAISHRNKAVAAGDGDDDICLPPWEDGHMICGIGQPKYKCCASEVFECKEFGRSGMFGCQPKSRMDEVATKKKAKDVEALVDDDEICLPPWFIAHMICGIREPRYKCCEPEMECKKLGPEESEVFGCLPKDEEEL